MRRVWLSALLLVAGCVTHTDTRPIADRFWQMTGKLSVSYQGKTRVVAVDWRQKGNDSEITLKGPFNSGRADVVVHADAVWVDLGDGPQRLSTGELIRLGDRSLPLPWRALSYWIRGRTGPDGDVLPDRYEQGDWRILTLRRGPDGPELMAFEHPDIDLRLRIQGLSGSI